MNCIAKCKPGYTGTRCESCESEDLVVSGNNGLVNENGQGVKCSKYSFQITNLMTVKKNIQIFLTFRYLFNNNC